MPVCFDRIGLFVNDLRKIAKFYRDVLGLEQMRLYKTEGKRIEISMAG
jgi:catechol 2,3-dioxygenase-like lactoylglutathione lyase family enzyme